MEKAVKNPSHVAIIMDGNRRWARMHGFSVFEGHRRGEECTEPLIDEAITIGIPYLTFWAFSTENWGRSKPEVQFLIKLFRTVLDRKVDKFHRKNVKLNVIGDLTKFPEDLQRKAEEWMKQTRNNKKITVNIALNYGGRDEIIRAISKYKNSQLTTNNSQLTFQEFEKFLDTAGQPDPELIIRTGGVKRLSGFMLWQSQYAELYFTDLNWPDFTPVEFRKAIEYFHHCQRRFGK